jgi:hypothetical protein
MRLASLIIAASLVVAGAASAQTTSTTNQPNNIRDQKDVPTTAPPETNPSPNPSGSTSTVRPNTPAPEASEKK